MTEPHQNPADTAEALEPAGTAEAPKPADTAGLPPKPKRPTLPKEIGGTNGPEPTRYGDWEHKGRCTDF